MSSKLSIEQILKSPCTSCWLRDALRSALKRDLIDAIDDAEYLVEILVRQLKLVQLEQLELVQTDRDF